MCRSTSKPVTYTKNKTSVDSTELTSSFTDHSKQRKLTQSLQHQRSATTKKSVSFSPKTRVRIIAPICLYSKPEIDSCWSNEEEDFRSKCHISKTLEAMRKGRLYTHVDDVDDERLCPRGLEDLYSEENRQQLTETRHRVLCAVMIEQDRQWSSGLVDECRIAAASARESFVSRKKALVAAAVDASGVRRSSIDM